MSKDIFESDESVIDELDVDNSSIFTLEEELKNQSKKEAKYLRLAFFANKKVGRLKLALEIVVAGIIDDEKKKGNLSSTYAVAEFRKTQFPLYPKWVEVRKKLSDAEAEAGYLNGLVSTWGGRGFRLTDVTKISDRLLWDEPRVMSSSRHPQESTERKLDRMGNQLEVE